MISLKKSLSEMEQLEELFRTSLQCYISAVGSIESHQVEAGRDLLGEHRRQLKDLRRRVVSDPAVETLQQTSAELDEALKRYAELAGGFFRQKQAEIRKILDILAEAAETLSVRTDDYATQFRGVAQELETASEVDDLAEVRRRLAAGVTRLKQYVDTMQTENRGAASQLHGELSVFQRRLEQAEMLAATDPLTGLANRREAERLIAEKVRADQRFTIMLFDLDGFKSINDRYGHHVGDQVLRGFARSLVGQYRAEDVVCRWGGDEFLAVVKASLKNSLARAQEIAAKTRGPYPIRIAGKEVVVNVGASVGVAERRANETSEELFARADAFLYQDKALLSAR